MIKPKVLRLRAWDVVNDAKSLNRYISLPLGSRGDSEEIKRILAIFAKNDYLRTNDEFEDTIHAINEMSDTSENHLRTMSHSYILQFPNQISAHVSVEDEYYGGGNYMLSVSVDGIIAYGEHADQDYEDVVNWLNKVFNG